MNMNLKKVVASILSVAVLTTSLVGVNANASTDNISFINFGIYSSNSGWTRFNQVASKSNDTWVYLYISSASRPTRVHTLAVSSYDYSVTHVCTCNPIGAYCEDGKEYLICNTIYEDGYRKADLKAYSIDPYYGDVITGVWSPDSVIETYHYYYYE